MAALSKVTFELRYQELLRRRLGTYEHSVYVNPGQPVKDMKIEVFVTETQKITYFRVPPLKSINAEMLGDNAGKSQFYIDCSELISIIYIFFIQLDLLISLSLDLIAFFYYNCFPFPFSTKVGFLSTQICRVIVIDSFRLACGTSSSITSQM